jgi:membrane protein YdbS with pleckstrin-like domain
MGAVGADVPLRVPRYRVHPTARWLWALEGLAVAVGYSAAALGAWFAVPADAGAARAIADVLPWLALPLAVLLVVVQPLWRFRVHRWEITDQVVYTQVGWLTRTWRIVPIARIQTVDTTRGPAQQILGLSTVIIRTASHAGSTNIEHLDARTADAVAHDLALRANAVRDEVT